MKIPGMKCGARLGPSKSASVAVAVLLAAGALSGWGISTAFGTRAAAVESPFQVTRNADLGSIEATKAGLVRSYVVTGTDSDGKSYLGSHILDVSMAPSAPSSSTGTTASRSESARSSATFWPSRV
jgi:hypothetical protein